jgi:hypothetical protein
MEIAPDRGAPRRRWFRFSLRTLLVVTTLLACWLGYQVRRWNERDKAIAQLQALGGEVFFGTNPTPQWLVAMFGEKPFRRVGVVNLHRLPATDEHLRLMAWFPDVETVAINRSKVTDAGIKHLAGRSKLWWLEMEAIDIGDEGLLQLKDLPSLITLRLNDTRVTYEGVKQILPRFNKLQELWINRTRVTPEEVAAIRAAWPKLQVVYDRQGKK